MKRTGWFILGVVVTGAFAWKASTAITRWEYYVKVPCDELVNGVFEQPNITQTLNALGTKGWELVAVLPGGQCAHPGSATYGVYLLKRPLP